MDIKDIKLSTITQPIVKALHRFHVVIFTVVVLGGLSFIILSLYRTTINASDTSNFSPNESATAFDQDTIDRLEKLKDPKDASSVSLPKGRINPFVE